MGWLNVYLLYRWEGKNENEVGRCKETGKIHVTVNHKYYRPTEVVRKCFLLALQMNNPITQPINCCIWPAVCENGLIALLLAAFRAQISLLLALSQPATWEQAALPRRSGFVLSQRHFSASATPSEWEKECFRGWDITLWETKQSVNQLVPKGYVVTSPAPRREGRGRWVLIGLISKVTPSVSP